MKTILKQKKKDKEYYYFFKKNMERKFTCFKKIISLYKNSPFSFGIRLFIKDNLHSKTFNGNIGIFYYRYT